MPKNSESVIDDVVGRFLGGDDEPAHESSNTPEQGDEADEGASSSEQDEGGDGSDTGDTQDTARAGDSKGDKGDSASKQQPRGQGQGNKQAAPGAQDLVDPRTGQVLARAGKERRVWEGASNYVRNQFQTALRQVDGTVRELQGKVAAYEQNNRTAIEHQVTPAETEAGIKLVAAFKKDPVATVKYLLEQAKARGHNIDLGEGSVAGIDAAAMARMMDQRLAPLLTEHENRERVQTAYKDAENELGQFYSRYPHARANEDELNRLLQQFPDLSLETAYLRLENFALQNGLDINRPIIQQARQRQAQNQRPNPGQRPLPNGRAAPGVAAMNGNPNGTGRIAHEDTSYRDIVKEAMREAGLRTN